MLKDLLQVLLDLFVKKSETEWIAEQSVPSVASRAVSISAQQIQQDFTYIPPSNGYLSARIDGSVSDNGIYLGNKDYDGICSIAERTSTGYSGTSIRVRKGAAVNIWLPTTPTMLKFYPDEGS